MGTARNDAPAEATRILPEQHQGIDNTSLNPERQSLLKGNNDSSYRNAFAGLNNEEAEKHVVSLGFPKGKDVANFHGEKKSPEAGRDASDQFKGVTAEKATGDYIHTLQRAGFSKAEAEDLAKQTSDRYKDVKDGGESHLKGTPAEQMARLNKAMTDVLDKTGVRDGKLNDGQTDHLTDKDRQNLVKDLASRAADPAKFVVQGDHYSCVLQARQKQLLEAGDPARVAEMTASVVNNGSAEVKELNGTTRTVHVDSRSFKPDGESSLAFNSVTHGSEGKRGMAGHVWDSLAGQTVADLKAERKGKPTSENGIAGAHNVFMAAHADEYGAITKTGEGLFTKDKNGQYQFKADNPDAALWDIAHLNRAMGGHEGAVFAHRNLRGSDSPPPGFPPDLTVTTFGSMDELRSKLGRHQGDTGQSAVISVDAPFLPGGGADGHGMHSMNISLNKELNKDGKRSFRLDNNWPEGSDLAMVSDAAVNKATNPEEWNAVGRPTADTVYRPDSGRNPNESQAEADKRREADAKRKESEAREEEQKKQEEKRKKEEKEATDRKEKEETDRREKDALDLKQKEIMAALKRKELYELEQRERDEKIVAHVQPAAVNVG